MTYSWWRRSIELNLDSAFLGASLAVRAMLHQGRGGSIISVVSVWGTTGSSPVSPMPGCSAAKGAILNFTREVASEYATQGIRVHAICPGMFDTHIGGGPVCGDPETRSRLGELSAMNRVAVPAELGGAIVFLALSAASFVTGSQIVVDGGMAART
jgi:NAD(P)-dependent dehydrogenase (short-subunit alcohol dehydrogenase family)